MLIGWTKLCDCEADFTHPDGSGKEVPAMELDHYARKCPNPTFPRTLAEALYQDTQRKRYDREDWVPSGSQITACPIETFYLVHNSFIEDPLEMRFRLRGTFAHEGILLRNKNQEDWIIEERMEMPLEYDDGFKFSLFGTLDCYYRPEAALYDLKTQQEGALDKKGRQTDEELFQDRWVKQYSNQINVYKVMAEEILGVPVKKLELQFFDGRLHFRPLQIPIVDKDVMIRSMKTRFRELYEVVNELKPLEEAQSRYNNINEFPINKSPVKYLVRPHLRRAA